MINKKVVPQPVVIPRFNLGVRPIRIQKCLPYTQRGHTILASGKYVDSAYTIEPTCGKPKKQG